MTPLLLRLERVDLPVPPHEEPALRHDGDEGERPDALEYDHFQISLTLIKLFASEALKNGNLSEGFQLVAECAGPMAAFPQDAV